MNGHPSFRYCLARSFLSTIWGAVAIAAVLLAARVAS
jgi:hypothetical protein